MHCLLAYCSSCLFPKKRNKEVLGVEELLVDIFTCVCWGLYLASSSVASAIANLTPAITFVMAYIIGLEKIDLGSTKSLAKITGTIICIAGAIAMAFVKGPKLLNMEFMPRNSVLKQEGQETWLLGCLLLFGSACFWSFWLILQVPVSASYPDHLALTAWMCLFAAMQTGTLTLILEHDMNAWKLNSSLQIFSCFLGGIASAVTFFAQAWCISRRGPLFSAMFNPLGTVVVTVLACVFLHEELYIGSSVGALAVIIGLYIVLWGKAGDKMEDTSRMEKERHQTMPADNCRNNIDLEEPLLPENSDYSFGKSPA
ncbi:WAT1-related protein At4g30420 isoform X2 [Henckelia pumila]|uniref:WAT1-related protein At4g30420 isoform X2 n=1 Tax=Henckelia pumila TaxID=405737 RepID=UPI003C6E0AD3